MYYFVSSELPERIFNHTLLIPLKETGLFVINHYMFVIDHEQDRRFMIDRDQSGSILTVSDRS